MKKLINSVSVKLALKTLVANGSVKNLHLTVKGNTLYIGEVIFTDNNKDSKLDISFNKEAGGDLKLSGNHDCTIVVKNLNISGVSGEEFSIEHLELNSVGEAAELFASILK